jgi:hypothetical protein
MVEKIVKKIVLIHLLVVFPFLGFSQSLEELDDYSVDELYKKIDLDYGTLDPSGSSIDFVYVKTSLKDGLYDVEITDGSGDIYEIKGSNVYLKFNSYFGYAGYGTECYLEVSGYSVTIYKKD